MMRAALILALVALSAAHMDLSRRRLAADSPKGSGADVTSIVGVWNPVNGTSKFFSSEIATMIMAKQFGDKGKVDAAKAFADAQDPSTLADIIPGGAGGRPKQPDAQIVIYGANADTAFFAGAVVARDGDKVMGAHTIEGFVYLSNDDGSGTPVVTIEGATSNGELHMYGTVSNTDGRLDVHISNRLTPHTDIPVNIAYLAEGGYEKSDESVDDALLAVAEKLAKEFNTSSSNRKK